MSEVTPRTKLPVFHPDYRYAGESRNPYAEKLKELEGRIYWDNGTEEHRGEWRKYFPDSIGKRTSSKRELHVEIGCNAGHVTVEWAARNSKAAYIGIDWKFKPIFRAAEKTVKRKIDNALFFRAQAERLPFMFGEEEIDYLHLFFPDPWPRKKQWKNRFVSERTLRAIAPALSKTGIFHIKTDHSGYFDWMLEAIEQTKDVWEVLEMTRDLHGSHPDPTKLEIPDVTLFERLFIKDGIKINSVKLKRK